MDPATDRSGQWQVTFWTDHHAYAFDAGLRALAPQSPTGAGEDGGT